MVRVIEEWVKIDPVAASELIMREELYNNGPALHIMAFMWSQKDPTAAAEWALKLPEGNTRNSALNNVALQWAGIDPEKAKRWIEESSLSQEEKDKLLKQMEKK